MLGARLTIPTLLAILSLASAREADASCDEIEKGDVEACKAEVERSCSEDDPDDNEGERAWKRSQCENRIAETHEQCGNNRYDKAAARAGVLFERADRYRPTGYRPHFDENWIARAKSIEADAAEYARFVEEWGMCSGGFTDQDAKAMKKAPRAYLDAYQGAVDASLVEMEERMKRPDLEPEEGRPDFPVEDMYRETAEHLLAVAKELPATFRYKKKDLEAALARSDENQVARDAWLEAKQAAKTAAAACPKGKRLKGAHLRVVQAEFDGDKNVKRRIYRQTLARHKSRNGTISLDNIPVAVCTEYREKGKAPYCTSHNVTVFREKAPGGDWTSWQLAVGVGAAINCKKMK